MDGYRKAGILKAKTAPLKQASLHTVFPFGKPQALSTNLITLQTGEDREDLRYKLIYR